MRKLNSGGTNVNNSDLVNYPDARIKDNNGSGNGTPVNERVYGDLHQTIAKLMRRFGITPNNLPDNETNGFQIVDAFKALPSKNDFVLALNVSSGVLSVPIKLGFMETAEQVVCKASFDLGSETQIKGSDNVTFAFTPNGTFKTNEYVRLIKTSGGVDIIRLVDNVSLDTMVSDLSYLKKATQAEENAGSIDTKATTPKVNKVTFTKRVNGTDSPTYLASTSQNGLLSTAQWDLLTLLAKTKNRGLFSGLNIAVTTGSLTVGGDIASAVASVDGDNSVILVTMSNNMTNTNYKVTSCIESSSDDVANATVCAPVFKPLSVSQFKILLHETNSVTQNLKLHLEVVQL